jgi:hypothetical protein
MVARIGAAGKLGDEELAEFDGRIDGNMGQPTGTVF